MAGEGESLESWLNKATNPTNRQEDWEYIMGFCDQINKELEGPQISVRLLAHKIQSPQEWEAIQALTVLEACMKNCGRRFHSEVGKFRFLNELIKVVSPKYLGDKVSERVKAKVIEMLYSWTVSLPDEAKISEAYQMLKTQGIVSVDPEIPLDNALIPSPPPRPKNPVFDNEEKSRRLAELLKSKKPEDLQEANRLIKNMVKEDEVRAQRATKQKSTLEEVNNSVKLLNEMLTHFSPEDSTDGDKELIRELYGDCDKLRRTVFQLATETEDNDSSLGDILQASDDLSRVINSYKKIVEGQTINGEAEEALMRSSTRQGTKPPGSTTQSEILIDLAGLDVRSPSPPDQQPPASSPSIPADLLYGSAASTNPQSPSPSTPSTALSLLDGELLSLGLNDPVPVLCKSTVPKHENSNDHLTSLQDASQDFDLFGTTSLPVPAFSTSSLFTDSLSVTLAPVSPPQSSTTASALAFPGPVFPPPPVSAVSTTSVTVPPPPPGAALTATAPAALPQSYSMAASSLSSPAAPVVPPQRSSAASFHPSGVAQSASASLNHSLQDLAMLDLGSPKNPGVPLSTPIPLLLEGVPGGSAPPPVTSQADDSPLLRSLSPILPLSQASPARGEEVSLANVFVPLDTIKP
ncbi:ADP-ribosylation factor-binding protein GGA3-like, partial [Centroberyx affinis]|uniref:ADP-ribosylation factor-binding protein GGA3-like n=1 Tax=Centroberyx affinis TaxID=166261 RepID=UPI003A5BF0B0